MEKFKLCILSIIAIVITGCGGMKQQFNRDVQNLYSGIDTTTLKIVTEQDIHGLPTPVQKYLEYTGIIGKPVYSSVRLKQKGGFRMKKEQDWVPLIAEQYYNTESAGFVWLGKIKMIPLVTVTGKDVFYNGHGNLLVKIAGIKTLVDAKGPELDESELIRYLSEMVWYPFAFTKENISWQSLDDSAAKATITLGDLSVSGIFHFNQEYQIIKFTAKRYMEVDGINVLKNWVTPMGSYKEINSINIPTKGQAIWQLETGDFSYFDGEIVAINYGVPELYK